MENNGFTYTVVAPVYNSEDTIPELIQRIETAMSPYQPYELLLIDDLSSDNSWDILKKEKANRSHIKLLRLTKNFGQAAVLVCGINEAKANIIITIDDDLQYPPEEIPKLIENYDPKEKYILFGVPRREKTNSFSSFTSKLVERFINQFVLSGKQNIKFSSFRIQTKKMYNRERYNESRMKSVQIFFNMVSSSLMDYIYVDHHPRRKGKSRYNFLKRIKIFLELVTVTTDVILYLFIIFLFLFLLGSVFLLVNHFVKMLTIPGWFYSVALAAGFSMILLGFTILFINLKSVYLSHLGEEAYAIWEEA